MVKTRVTQRDIVSMIDHSVLLPNLTREEATQAILIGAKYGTASCCVRPCDVSLAKTILDQEAVQNNSNPSVPVCTVIGFPHGSATTASKCFETQNTLEEGATEIDMVLNISRLRSNTKEDDAYVLQDITAVVQTARKFTETHPNHPQIIVKVIMENAYLNEEQKIKACQLIEKAGADFVKTSTGFAQSGSTLPDLKLMRANTSPHIQVKAAGGIRTLDALLAAKAVGATRIGATATVSLVDEFIKRSIPGTDYMEVDFDELRGENSNGSSHSNNSTSTGTTY